MWRIRIFLQVIHVRSVLRFYQVRIFHKCNVNMCEKKKHSYLSRVINSFVFVTGLTNTFIFVKEVKMTFLFYLFYFLPIIVSGTYILTYMYISLTLKCGYFLTSVDPYIPSHILHSCPALPCHAMPSLSCPAQLGSVQPSPVLPFPILRINKCFGNVGNCRRGDTVGRSRS